MWRYWMWRSNGRSMYDKRGLWQVYAWLKRISLLWWQRTYNNNECQDPFRQTILEWIQHFLRDPTIDRSPTIKSSCKNMINNHEHSVQVIEREDVNGGPALKVDDGLNKNNTSDVYCNEITLPLSIPRKTIDHDVPYILAINSQVDLSRSTRTNSDKKEQLFHSFVTNNSSDINPINKDLTKTVRPTQQRIQSNIIPE